MIIDLKHMNIYEMDDKNIIDKLGQCKIKENNNFALQF